MKRVFCTVKVQEFWGTWISPVCMTFDTGHPCPQMRLKDDNFRYVLSSCLHRDRNSPLETKEPIVYHQVAHRLYSRPIQATTLLTQDNPESDRILFCHIVKSTYLCFPDSRLALNLYIKIMINVAFKHSMFALVTFPVAMVKYSDTYCSLRGSPSRWGRKFEAVGFFL